MLYLAGNPITGVGSFKPSNTRQAYSCIYTPYLAYSQHRSVSRLCFQKWNSHNILFEGLKPCLTGRVAQEKRFVKSL